MGNGKSSYLGYGDFSNSLHVSYLDYLQTREFEDSIRFGMSEQTQMLIANQKELAAEGFSLAVEHSKDISDGLAVISKGIEETLSNAISDIDSTFNWFFPKLLLALEGLNDSLSELLRYAKTPAQTWAFEQYDIARDEIRRDLYPEALESINRAINGFGANPGFRSEFRFHFLLGMIRLGSNSNRSPDIVRLDEAEDSFRNAARYARFDHKMDAARALLGAARAAYVQGNLTNARQYLEEGVALHDFGEIRYMLAKVSGAMDDWDSLELNLWEAVFWDRGYIIKAPDDMDFRHFGIKFDDFLLKLVDHVKSYYDEAASEFEGVLLDVKKSALDGFSMDDYAKPGIGEIEEKLELARKAAESKTFFGYTDAFIILGEPKDSREKCLNFYKKSVTCAIDNKISEERRSLEIIKDKARLKSSIFDPVFIFSVIVIELFFVYGGVELYQSGKMLDGIGLFVMGTFINWPVSWLVAFVARVFQSMFFGIRDLQSGAAVRESDSRVAELRVIRENIETLK